MVDYSGILSVWQMLDYSGRLFGRWLIIQAYCQFGRCLIIQACCQFGRCLIIQIFSSYLSRSLADRWGTTIDFTTSFLHSSRFSAFCSSIFHSRPVHSLILSSHRFLCLPLRLPPWTVPSRIVLASPDDRVMCPYHFSSGRQLVNLVVCLFVRQMVIC